MGADADPQMVALARQVERATRRVDNVELLVRQLAADVTALTSAVGDPVEPDEDTDADAVRSWLFTDDPDTARADLTDLVQWLGAVYLRYPAATLPSCWLWHPAVVEELWWLRNAHKAAYDGAWRDVADWHDRMRPGVIKRLSAAVGGCELARHAASGDRAQALSVVPLVDAADQIAQTWTTSTSTPTPTDDQLTEAETYDRAQHQRTNR